MKMDSEDHQAIWKAIQKAGWRWRQGKRHIVVYPPGGGRPLILSATAQDGPATRNTRAQFKRAGLDV